MIRKRQPIQNGCGFVAHANHDSPQLAFVFRQAVLAFLMRVSACARNERQRAVGQAQYIAIANVDGRQSQPIAAVPPTQSGDEASARQLGQDDRQELSWDVLRRRDIGEMNRPLTIMSCEMLKSPDRVAGALRQHAYLIGRE